MALSIAGVCGLMYATVITGVQNYEGMKETIDRSVDLNSVCQQQDQSFAYLASSGSMGWKCAPFGLTPDVQSWCAAMYGESSSAIALNNEDAFSWKCKI